MGVGILGLQARVNMGTIDIRTCSCTYLSHALTLELEVQFDKLSIANITYFDCHEFHIRRQLSKSPCCFKEENQGPFGFFVLSVEQNDLTRLTDCS